MLLMELREASAPPAVCRPAGVSDTEKGPDRCTQSGAASLGLRAVGQGVWSALREIAVSCAGAIRSQLAPLRQVAHFRIGKND